MPRIPRPSTVISSPLAHEASHGHPSHPLSGFRWPKTSQVQLDDHWPLSSSPIARPTAAWTWPMLVVAGHWWLSIHISSYKSSNNKIISYIKQIAVETETLRASWTNTCIHELFIWYSMKALFMLDPIGYGRRRLCSTWLDASCSYNGSSLMVTGINGSLLDLGSRDPQYRSKGGGGSEGWIWIWSSRIGIGSVGGEFRRWESTGKMKANKGQLSLS